MDYKDIANRLRKWANGETCEDCPAKTDLAFCAADAITYLLDELSELEAKNIRLQGQVENANVACAKWEGLFRAELEKNPVWVSINDKMPEKDEEVLLRFESGNMAVGWWDSFSECIVDWYCYAGDDFYEYCFDTPTHWMPLPEPPKEE